MRKRIFISSVQKEFAQERQALGDYLAGDALLRRFFDIFIFERDVPASDRRPDEVYLDEVARCDVYLGLFGNEYGWQNEDGLSPTHLEFNEATSQKKYRVIFVKGVDDQDKQSEMKSLIRSAGEQLIRRRFSNMAELLSSVYASLVDYLESEELIRVGPWDAAAPLKATMDDIDPEKVSRFVHLATYSRGFPLPEDSPVENVLRHLSLMAGDRPSHAAILLFAKQPSVLSCVPRSSALIFMEPRLPNRIPSYQVYKGSSFELVDQAVDFVMSKINLSVGTRDLSNQAPVNYEIPRAVVAEAIVNAVAHRDYTSNGSVQVMLFADRLEVWNPGTLPPSLDLKKLRQPHGSVPANPLLAEPLYLTKYIERMGTGTRDMIKRCVDAGLPEPEFALTDGFVTTIRRPVTPQVTPQDTPQVGAQSGAQLGPSRHQVGTKSGPSRDQVGTKSGLSRDQADIMRKCFEDRAIGALMQIAGRSNRTKFRHQVLKPLLEDGWIEMTIPEKPTSSNQKYRTTELGRALLDQLEQRGKGS